MTINISKYFDKVSEQVWLDAALKSLKLDDLEKFEKRLNFKTCEGVTLNSSYHPQLCSIRQPTETLVSLTTFPTSHKLVRFTDLKGTEDQNEGVDLFIGSQELKTNYIDIFSLFMDNNKDGNALKAFLDKQDNQDRKIYIDTTKIHNAGASIIQELSFILSVVKYSQEFLKLNQEIIIAVSVDSLYFNNIAKLRALRFLLESLSEKCDIPKFKILSRSSLREQTVYDPWMNMLRNTTSASASFQGGADLIAIDSYDCIASSYGDNTESDLGSRQSRNAYHVLKQESSLGTVSDPSQGSYAIEKLTAQYIELSFDRFKHIENEGGIFANLNKLALEVELIAKERSARVANLNSTLAGINNYPNTQETITKLFPKNLSLCQTKDLFPLRRAACEFEKLRQSLESHDFKITILVYGPKDKLSNRVMFCSNYFEVLGHKCEVIYKNNSEVIELKKVDGLVLCSLDDLYPELLKKLEIDEIDNVFIAGNNFKNAKCQNIFKGQNVLEVLNTYFAKETN